MNRNDRNREVKIKSKIWSQLPPEVVERIVAFLGCKKKYMEVYKADFIPESLLDIIRSLTVERFLKETFGFTPRYEFSDYFYKTIKIVDNDEIQYKNVIDQEFVRQMFIAHLKSDKWEQLYRIFIMSFVLMSVDERKNLAHSVHHELKKIEQYIFNEMKLYASSRPEKKYDKYLEFESVEDLIKFFICFELRNCLNDSLKRDFLNQVWKKNLYYGELKYAFSCMFAFEDWIHHLDWFVLIGKHLRNSSDYMKRYKIFEKEESAFFFYFTEVDVNKFKSLVPYCGL